MMIFSRGTCAWAAVVKSIAAAIIANALRIFFPAFPAMMAAFASKTQTVLTGFACPGENGVMRILTFLLVMLLAVPMAHAADDAALSPAANAAWLAANARKPGTITRPSGLQYRILRSGTGSRPGGDDLLRVAYTVRLINGAVVDSTNPALPVTISQPSVNMAGLAEALSLMHVGDRWQLALPANLALGAKGAANGAVPPNQTLLFDMTLISATPPAPGQTVTDNPFSVWASGRENGAAFTIHP